MTNYNNIQEVTKFTEEIVNRYSQSILKDVSVEVYLHPMPVLAEFAACYSSELHAICLYANVIASHSHVADIDTDLYFKAVLMHELGHSVDPKVKEMHPTVVKLTNEVKTLVDNKQYRKAIRKHKKLNKIMYKHEVNAAKYSLGFALDQEEIAAVKKMNKLNLETYKTLQRSSIDFIKNKRRLDRPSLEGELV